MIWRRLSGLMYLAVALSASTGIAQQMSTTIHGSSEYLSAALKAEQADLMQNRGMLWVDQGTALWNEAQGIEQKSCASCHGEPQASMRGVAARYPMVDPASGHLLNLEARINQCRTERQHARALSYETNELLGLTALVALQSRGMPVAVRTDGAAAPFNEIGRTLWQQRQGQLNLSCAQCHDANVGRKLRGDTISSGINTGYPAYRLEWQGLGSFHRRLRACQLGVRAIQFPQGAPEYLALELYIASRARGLPVEAPALRR